MSPNLSILLARLYILLQVLRSLRKIDAFTLVCLRACLVLLPGISGVIVEFISVVVM
jgi:hypothetical protein